MIKVQFVSSDTCAHCVQALEALERIKKEKADLEIEKVDLTRPEGQKLAQQYGIMASPGIIIDGELAFQGGASEEQLRKKILAH